jgi:amino acid permease
MKLTRRPRPRSRLCFFVDAAALQFYLELQNNTLARYHTVVASSFGIAILLMGFITAMGFLTFGESAAGLVLNNYASKDAWMGASRVAVAVSLVFSYPLAFQGCRDGVLDLLEVSPEKKTNPAFLNLTTVALLSLLTLLAANLTDVKIVLSVAGGTLGNALTFLYPALMYRAVVKKQNRKDQSTGVLVANAAAVMGVVLGAIGTKMALE